MVVDPSPTKYTGFPNHFDEEPYDNLNEQGDPESKAVNYIAFSSEDEIIIRSTDDDIIKDVLHFTSEDQKVNIQGIDPMQPQEVRRIFRLQDTLPDWVSDIPNFGKKERINDIEAEALYGIKPNPDVKSDNPLEKYRRYLDLYLKPDLTPEDELELLGFLNQFRKLVNHDGTLISIDRRIVINIGPVFNLAPKPNGRVEIYLAILVVGVVLLSLGVITIGIYSMRTAQASERNLLNSEETLNVAVDAAGNVAIKSRWRGFGILDNVFKERRERRLDEIRDENIQRGLREWGLKKSRRPKGN